MPIKVNGEKYYWSGEACKIVGISKNTFIRWVKEGVFADIEQKDRRGWRLFTDRDLGRLRSEVNKVQITKSTKL